MHDSNDGQQPTPDWVAALQARRARDKAERPSILAAGEAALRRLLPIAQGDSGQCRVIAAFLLSCYHGGRFPFDLTDFRLLDRELFDDCMDVLRMDRSPVQEVHCYFDNGGEIFEKLAADWRVRDRLAEDRARERS
jgi:hypothetical protein